MEKGIKLAYVRVSTADQNEERQIKALEKHNIDKWYKEKISGKTKNRPKLKELLDYCREGDTIYIHDLSRLARNTKDLLEIIEYLEDKKVSLYSNKENIDTSTATGKLYITIIGAIAEFERTNLLERQREGIALAKAKGKYKGRKAIEIQADKWESELNKYKTRQTNKGQFAKNLNVSRPTLDKLLKEYAKGETRHFK